MEPEWPGEGEGASGEEGSSGRGATSARPVQWSIKTDEEKESEAHVEWLERKLQTLKSGVRRARPGAEGGMEELGEEAGGSDEEAGEATSSRPLEDDPGLHLLYNHGAGYNSSESHRGRRTISSPSDFQERLHRSDFDLRRGGGGGMLRSGSQNSRADGSRERPSFFGDSPFDEDENSLSHYRRGSISSSAFESSAGQEDEGDGEGESGKAGPSADGLYGRNGAFVRFAPRIRVSRPRASHGASLASSFSASLHTASPRPQFLWATAASDADDGDDDDDASYNRRRRSSSSSSFFGLPSQMFSTGGRLSGWFARMLSSENDDDDEDDDDDDNGKLRRTRSIMSGGENDAAGERTPIRSGTALPGRSLLRSSTLPNPTKTYGTYGPQAPMSAQRGGAARREGDAAGEGEGANGERDGDEEANPRAAHANPDYNSDDEELERARQAPRKTEEEVIFGPWPGRVVRWEWWRSKMAGCWAHCCEDDEEDEDESYY